MALGTGPIPPPPYKFCPVPKRLKRSYFWPKLSDTSRQKKDREKKQQHQIRPVASQYASTAMLQTPTNHQRLQENIPRINIKPLTRMFCYSSHKIATSIKN